jgi:adenylylsulfate kinase-like enzyme
VPVIIWLNGGFGAGKTTLAEELHRRLPDRLTPAELADEVLARADLHRAHGDAKRPRSVGQRCLCSAN